MTLQTSDWVHDVRASAPLPLGAPHPPERASKWNDNALCSYICKEGRPLGVCLQRVTYGPDAWPGCGVWFTCEL